MTGVQTCALPILIRRPLATLVYGDLLMLLDNQVKPYECEKGQSEALVSSWINKLTELFKQGQAYSQKEMVRYLDEIAKSFAAIPVNRTPKVRVGIVGEIYVKYSAVANNGLERFLNEQDCEVMVPGILAFMLFKVDNRLEDIKDVYKRQMFPISNIQLCMRTRLTEVTVRYGQTAIKMLNPYHIVQTVHKIVIITASNQARIRADFKSGLAGIGIAIR